MVSQTPLDVVPPPSREHLSWIPEVHGKPLLEQRGKYMDGWADGIKASNEERHPRGMIKLLKERGLIDEAILNDKKLGRVFKEEMYDDMGTLLTEDLSVGYTKTELKNILHYGRRLR